MLPKSNWSHLIPHAGTMCLLDAVLECDAGRIHAIAATHAGTDNPLRADGRLHAIALCEYGAQAMAVHGALRERGAGGLARPGFLVGLRDVILHAERIDDLPGRLQVHVECLIATPGSLQYAFRIEHDGNVLASGRATVMLQVVGEDR